MPALPTRRLLATALLLAACSNDTDTADSASTDAANAATTDAADATVTTPAPGTVVSTSTEGEAPTATGAAAPTTSAEPGPSGDGCGPVVAADATLADGTSTRPPQDVIATTPELSQLADAIDAAGAGGLFTDGPVTVFAPTNAAFAALDPATRDALLADPEGRLATLLARHVVVGDRPLADLVDQGTFPSGAGPVTASAAGARVLIDAGGGPATVTCRDITTGGGRIHVIDQLISAAPVDTNNVGGSRLFTVDLSTGAATDVGAFPGETGVLDVVAGDGPWLALTDAGELATFAGGDPNAVAPPVAISGLEMSTVLAVDRRDDGSLVGITDGSQIVIIDPLSGVAEPVAPLDPGVDDLGVGLDVDAEGTARFVVATGLAAVVDLVTGAIIETSAPPAFEAADPNEASPARVVAIASFGGVVYAVEAVTGTLTRLGGDGTLATIGPLGVTLTDGAGLDIADDGTALLTVPG